MRGRIQSPRSRDNRAALTRTPIGGEVEADFCLLGEADPKFSLVSSAIIRQHNFSFAFIYSRTLKDRCPSTMLWLIIEHGS